MSFFISGSTSYLAPGTGIAGGSASVSISPTAGNVSYDPTGTGNWNATPSSAGTYTITPSSPLTTFFPTSITVVLTAQNPQATNVNFFAVNGGSIAHSKDTVLGAFSTFQPNIPLSAFVNPQNLDLVQVIEPANGSVVFQIDYQANVRGNVTGGSGIPVVAPTTNTLLGTFSGGSLFNTDPFSTAIPAFKNSQGLDIFQVVTMGQTVIARIDASGVYHTIFAQ